MQFFLGKMIMLGKKGCQLLHMRELNIWLLKLQYKQIILCLNKKKSFFFIRPYMSKKFQIWLLSDLFPKMTHFLFLVVFFFVFLIPAIWDGGNEPLSDTCQIMTGWCRFNYFFFGSRQLKRRKWIFDFFFHFLFFYCNICILKTQIIINTKVLIIMIINFNT